jgi:hypothetical protein
MSASFPIPGKRICVTGSAGFGWRAHSAPAISESIWPLGNTWMRPVPMAFWTVLYVRDMSPDRQHQYGPAPFTSSLTRYTNPRAVMKSDL